MVHLSLLKKIYFDKASRAMFDLITKCSLSIDVRIKLFDSVVKPILMFGCEVWGFEGVGLADKLQLRFHKLLLYRNLRTPTHMFRNEKGVFPFSLDRKNRVLNYWFRIVKCMNEHRICKILFSCIHKSML